MTSGIYALRNTVSGGFYIGSTNNFDTRFRNHRGTLMRGVHDNPRLQAAWNKYGAAAFDFAPICLLSPSAALATEQRLLDRLALHPRCYNLSLTAKGSTPCPETRERMRVAQLGRTHPPEVREKIRAANAGRKFSAEHRARLSAANSGRTRRGTPHTPESKAKLRAAALKRPKIFGRTHTAESKAKMAAAKMGNRYGARDAR